MQSRPLVLACLVTLLLAGCGLRHEAAPHRAAAPADTSGPPLQRVSATQLQALAGAPGARATLVNVWASWCGPCREEFPALLGVMRRHPEARLLLVSADFDAQVGEARRYLRDHGITDTTYLKHGGDQPFIDALAPEWSRRAARHDRVRRTRQARGVLGGRGGLRALRGRARAG